MPTPVQHKIYLFIKEFLKHKSYSPSLVEVATGIGISPNSISLISRSIHALVKEGKLEFSKKGYRNVAVTEENPLHLPILGGPKKLDLQQLFTSKNHILIEMKDEHLADNGVLAGDLLICKTVEKVPEGSMVVALIDQAVATIKQISYQIQDRITLIPANRIEKPKAYLPHRIQVQGEFVGLLRLK